MFKNAIKKIFGHLPYTHGAAEEGANPKVRRLKKWKYHILVNTME